MSQDSLNHLLVRLHFLFAHLPRITLFALISCSRLCTDLTYTSITKKGFKIKRVLFKYYTYSNLMLFFNCFLCKVSKEIHQEGQSGTIGRTCISPVVKIKILKGIFHAFIGMGGDHESIWVSIVWINPI